MRFATIRSVTSDGTRVTVAVEQDEINDVVVAALKGTDPAFAAGDLCLLVPYGGPDGEEVALAAEFLTADTVSDPVVRKSEFDGHSHGPGSFSNGAGNVVGVSGGAGPVAGSSRFRVS